MGSCRSFVIRCRKNSWRWGHTDDLMISVSQVSRENQQKLLMKLPFISTSVFVPHWHHEDYVWFQCTSLDLKTMSKILTLSHEFHSWISTLPSQLSHQYPFSSLIIKSILSLKTLLNPKRPKILVQNLPSEYNNINLKQNAVLAYTRYAKNHEAQSTRWFKKYISWLLDRYFAQRRFRASLNNRYDSILTSYIKYKHTSPHLRKQKPRLPDPSFHRLPFSIQDLTSKHDQNSWDSIGISNLFS